MANLMTSNRTIVDQDKENQTTLTIYQNHTEDSTSAVTELSCAATDANADS